MDDAAVLAELRQQYPDDFLFKSSKQEGCIDEAFTLMETAGRGLVYYVIEVDGAPVNHAYYFDETQGVTSLAKNQADNGYEGYPALTCEQVQFFGFRLADRSAEELFLILDIFRVVSGIAAIG